MSKPSVKQRLWQALRLSKYSTSTDLQMVVGACKFTIHRHLRHWQSLGLVITAKSPRLGHGARPQIYSLKDPTVIDPPGKRVPDL
jgi:hypothetical protein